MENTKIEVTTKMAAVKENKEMPLETISEHLSVLQNSQHKLNKLSEQADAISRKLNTL